MADTRMDEFGSVVAFEGPPDVVSTQLRLLPTSPQILILPTVQCYIPSNDSDKAFEVRAYVRKVHDALTARHEAARCFLHGATTSNKRLAFLNGGTPSAHALCIKAIMKHETSGDRIEAEAVYAQLAKDGLAGLEAKSQIHSQAISGHAATFNDEFNDPITRAMRAADDLDRQTANLQHDMLDLAAATRPRSLSLPLYGYSDGFGDAAPFFLFGAQIEDEEDTDDDGPLTPEAPAFDVVDYNRPSKRLALDSADIRPASPCGIVGKSPVSSSLGVRHDIEMLSPGSRLSIARTRDRRSSGDSTTADLSASISSSKGALHRVRSLDRIYPLSAKLRDLCISGVSTEMEAEPDVARRSQSFMVSGEEEPALIRRISYIDRRRTIRSKGRQPSIKVDQNLLDKKARQGLDTAGPFLGTEVPFQPLLPWLEDLVVYFKNKTPNPLLSSIIKSFKAGNYPILSSSSLAFFYSRDTSAATTLHQPTALDQGYHDRAHETSVLNTADDDLDPFAHIRAVHSPKRIVPTVNVVRPPTPAQTPPPYIAKENKFYDIEVVSGQTAVAIQNSVRSILSKHFPPESEGYRRFQFSLLPEFDGMSKPVSRGSESRNSHRETNRRVDPILAIGSQQGVDRVYSSGIIKRLESIGTKTSDRQGRSGRVDFRYLLANAMQAFTALPLANQTSDNPFTNSYLLATLLIPHLETYLSLHSEIRYLLLEYPPEHLPTILALQKLVGVDLIKVAQIVDPNNPDRLPFTQIGGPAVGAKSDAKADAKTPNLSPQASSSDITVSNANLLLASTATDKDIAKFVSTVWNIHVEDGDAKYPPQKKSLPTRKSRPVPLDALFTKFSVSSELEPSPISAETSSSPESLTLSSRGPSFADNIMTPQSDTAQSRGFTRRQLRGDALSMATFDSVCEDSELDLEERRLMPMFMKPAEPNGNTRKALKFLGLA
ncbi:hypothetical protein J3F83DRAFT_509178 [Trichoderma novae-zelandiae]